jgi:hypothetical protein
MKPNISQPAAAPGDNEIREILARRTINRNKHWALSLALSNRMAAVWLRMATWPPAIHARSMEAPPFPPAD